MHLANVNKIWFFKDGGGGGRGSVSTPGWSVSEVLEEDAFTTPNV